MDMPSRGVRLSHGCLTCPVVPATRRASIVTINERRPAFLQNPEDDLDLNFLIGSKKEKLEPRAALSNSFGFGGHNSAVVFKKFEA